MVLGCARAESCPLGVAAPWSSTSSDTQTAAAGSVADSRSLVPAQTSGPARWAISRTRRCSAAGCPRSQPWPHLHGRPQVATPPPPLDAFQSRVQQPLQLDPGCLLQRLLSHVVLQRDAVLVLLQVCQGRPLSLQGVGCHLRLGSQLRRCMCRCAWWLQQPALHAEQGSKALMCSAADAASMALKGMKGLKGLGLIV